MQLKDPSECRARASEHEKLAVILASAPHEWAAVAYFYSTYHHVRAALIADPIFTDIGRLQAKNSSLIPDDRWVARHKGRRGAKVQPEFGINELVAILYPTYHVDYEVLHQASLEVRYGPGFTGDLERLGGAHDEIRDASASGLLIA